MPKIKLGTRPKTFKPFPVKFEMPDGTEGALTATFVYRTREEYAEFITANAKAAAPAEADDKPVMERVVAGIIAGNVDFLYGALDAWDLDVDLSEDSLRQLANEVPAAAQQLVGSYAEACLQGKLGN